MNEHQFELIERIFHGALDLEGDARRVFVENACAGDAELFDEVMSLLSAHGSADTFFEDPSVTPAIADVVEAFIAPEAEKGEPIGPYRIEKELGRGGMGTVYLAVRADGTFERKVALKLVRRGMDTEDILRRFYAERRILAPLDHPNIARFLDGGVTEDDRPFLVLEFVDGEPLLAYASERSLGVEEKLQLFLDICGAVQYAHQNLVVHRDLKPGNVFVTQDGTVKLLDFGIAKLISPDEDGHTALTRTGARMLTPDYAAPEQLCGEPVTTATDVYALGVLLYELLAGIHPFRKPGINTHELERAVLAGNVTRPSTAFRKAGADPQRTAPAAAGRTKRLWRSLAGDLDVIVLKALRREPERRYQSVEQMADDIRRHLTGLPVSGRRDSAVYRTTKFVKRHAYAIGGAAVIVLLLSAFTVTTFFQNQQIRRERDKAQQVSEFLVDLFMMNEPGSSQGETITAREILAAGNERIGNLADQPLLQAHMLHIIGRVYTQLGLFAEADTALSASLAIRTEWRGYRHPDVAETLASIASLRYAEGKYSEAEELLATVIQIHSRGRAADDPAVLVTLNRIGMSYLQRGEFESARRLFTDLLEAGKGTAYLADLDEYGALLSNLGAAYRGLGDLERAEPFYREALAVSRRHARGRDTESVAKSLNNLGMFLRHKGEYAAAVPHFRESYEMRRRIFGAVHPSVGIAAGNLAEIHRMEQQFDQADPLYREALAIADSLMEERHPFRLITLHNYAKLKQAQGAHEEAEQTFRAVIPAFRETLGPKHQNVVAALDGLAAAALASGNLDEAEAVGREALGLRREIHPPGHTYTAITLMNLGAILEAGQNYSEAEDLYREALEIRLAALSAGHRDVLDSRIKLAGCLEKSDRIPEALSIYEETLASLPAEGPDTAQLENIRHQLTRLRGRR